MASVNERKLLGAIEQVVNLVNVGMAPTDAVMKVASESQFRPGEVRLIANAYNTGRTRKQHELGDDPTEKTAAFELADAAAALESLYPAEFKSAAVVSRETSVSSEYFVSPGIILGRRKEAGQAKPLAFPPLPALEPYPSDPTFQIKQASGRRQRREHAVNEARLKMAVAMDTMASRFSELVTYFKTAAHMPFPTVRQAAITLYGSLGERVMARVGAFSPYIQKEAAAEVDYSVDTPPLPLVGRLIEAVNEYHSCSQEHAKAAMVAASEAEQERPPKPHDPSASILGFDKEAKPGNPFTGALVGSATGSMTKDMLTGIAQKISPPDENAGIASTMKSLTDPQHESNLRNIRMQSMLQDLMTDDPVISGYHPHEVMQAFNEIGELSPRAVDQKLLMQALLRKRLTQGHFDQFEVGDLLGINNKLQQRDAPPAQANAQPNTSIL